MSHTGVSDGKSLTDATGKNEPVIDVEANVSTTLFNYKGSQISAEVLNKAGLKLTLAWHRTCSSVATHDI